MLDTKVKLSSGSSFETLPVDKYTVQIVDVNLKKQLKFHSTEEEDVLVYQLAVLDDKKLESGESTRGKFLWKRCRLSINEKSWLGKMAKAVMGRDMTEDEKNNFDPESLVGQEVDVMVDQTPSKKDSETVFNNVVAFSKTLKKLDPISDNKGVSVAVTTATKSVVPETAPGDEDDIDAEVAALEAEAKLAKAKAAAAKAKKA